MPVHLYGSSADLNSIKKIIKNNKKKIYLVDDCSQAHGAIDESDNLKRIIGSTSDISCFSLYPGKNQYYHISEINKHNHDLIYNLSKKNFANEIYDILNKTNKLNNKSKLNNSWNINNNALIDKINEYL